MVWVLRLFCLLLEGSSHFVLFETIVWKDQFFFVKRTAYKLVNYHSPNKVTYLMWQMVLSL